MILQPNSWPMKGNKYAAAIPEHTIQANFIKWCSMNERKYPALRLSFAVPNAAQRSPRLGAWMKAEGLRAGVPDWLLPVPRKGASGFAIEFKSKTGRLTPAQYDYSTSLMAEGWVWRMFTDWRSAADEVEKYLC